MSLARTLVTILGLCLTSEASRRPAADPPAMRQLRVPDDPDHVYGRAVRAALAIGAHLLQQKNRTRFLSAQLPSAVLLYVVVTPKRWGALVDVQGIAPAHGAVGSAGTAVEDFLTAFQWPEEETPCPANP